MSKNNFDDSRALQICFVWQSLVVKGYRSFFAHVAAMAKGPLLLVSPDKFIELGGQTTSAEPFSKPFDGSEPSRQAAILSAKVWHTQAVLFTGLTKVLRQFFTQEGGRRVIVCVAEPYSLTAFFVWLQSTLVLGGRFKIGFYAAQNIRKDFSWPIRLLQAFLFRKASFILVVGEDQKRVLREHGYKGRCFDFPLWFDSQVFSSTAGKPRSIPHQRFSIGLIGGPLEEKGVYDLIDGCRDELADLQAHLEVVIAGKARDESRLEEVLAELKLQGWQVSYLGQLPFEKVADFYRSLDVLVVASRTMPHLKEQFGRVIIEAHACGCPVLGSDAGSIPKVVGDPKLVFPEGDKQALAQLLREVFVLSKDAVAYTELRNRVADRALRRFSDQATAANFLKQLLSLKS